MNDVLVCPRKDSPRILSRMRERIRWSSAALLGAALGILGTQLANAVPYATGLANNGGTVSFRLNESADSVKVVSNGGTTTNDLGALAAGTHSF